MEEVSNTSTDAVKPFLEHARQDAELMEGVRAAVAERGEQSSSELVKLALGYVYRFNATELVEHLVNGSAGMELSEAELEAVTGGITGGDETLGRIKNTLTPGLMTKRESEPDK